ncbi:hypothetical protein CALVIDRAFT_284359 [Calocera viscosa TUFC12733]|uniref:Uncharacterized protein n=1 Tax=Calocera viscosa (strain TUFC12733) TaxID=1330018 RepID=A0A167IU03_CALVF|nr:hypothetical protein CALVIDRAFT_284359 [Calocera viscosa TUFC12733]
MARPCIRRHASLPRLLAFFHRLPQAPTQHSGLRALPAAQDAMSYAPIYLTASQGTQYLSTSSTTRSASVFHFPTDNSNLPGALWLPLLPPLRAKHR